jgi:hypothetical protein
MSKCMCCSAIRPNSRVVANPDMHPFWGDFRVGGYPPATREDVRNDLRKGLDEWVGGVITHREDEHQACAKLS